MNDIILDTDNDILIKNGDLVIGDSKEQEVNLLLLTQAGDWKHDPLAGVGLLELINEELSEYEMKQVLKKGLAYDNKKLINYSKGILTIE